MSHNSISVRHWRLSIVDLTSGSNQPLANNDYIFAYNGEIYEYQNLSEKIFNSRYSSDTQLLFDLLISGQEEKARFASGFFSYVLVNKKAEIITGSRDFWGKKPFYYYQDEEIAIFASEETAIRALCNRHLTVNKKAILGYFQYKNTHFGQTYFENIKELVPGSVLSFNVKSWNLTVSREWESYYKTDLIDVLDPQLIDFDNNVKDGFFSEAELLSTMDKSVASRFNCDVEVQLALSGGIDSAALAAMAVSRSESKQKLKRCVTVKFDHVDNESRKAANIARQLGIPHTVIDFTTFDMIELLRLAVRAQGAPLEHPHGLAYFVLCKEVSRYGRVLLTGEGADELFFGYTHYMDGFSGSFAFRPHLDLYQYFEGDLSPFDTWFQGEKALRSKALTSNKCSRDLEIKTHLASLLRRNDRMSMANSVEIRAPYLDPNLLYQALRRDEANALLKNKSFMIQYLCNKLPRYVADKKKIGFHVPFDNWFAKNRSQPDVSRLIDLSAKYFFQTFGLKLKRMEVIDGRFGWVMCNIGMFLQEYWHGNY